MKKVKWWKMRISSGTIGSPMIFHGYHTQSPLGRLEVESIGTREQPEYVAFVSAFALCSDQGDGELRVFPPIQRAKRALEKLGFGEAE